MNSTIKKLEHDKFELEQKIKAKQIFLNKELLREERGEEDSEDAEGLNLSVAENKGKTGNTRETQMAAVKEGKEATQTSKMEEILTIKINEVFMNNLKQADIDAFGDRGNIGKMQAIENAFDEYLKDHNDFYKKYEAEWHECRKINAKVEKKKAIDLKEVNDKALKIKEKEDQLKNADKKRKHEGRYAMPRMFLQKRENKVVEVEVDEDYLDRIRYFN